ncbi:hypothetical protein [Stakelama tenebrarum]|uniref:Elongation factor P n=1 Tax=Stakelama tenebrarum TaxID=2711215 RepID=A0A6G6Y6X0_9SPHN|nr:hypothetical protein [Sphingosinithalassobacter tenebrarum]QIG80326.1 hypothetical protein G5C33_11420 [Sphingosinithalassobacter tenebrarum]
MRYAAFLMAAVIAAMPAAARAQDSTGAPGPISGDCVEKPPLADMLRNLDHARDVAVPRCDRALVEPGEGVTFYRGDRVALRFRGHRDGDGDIEMDGVAIGDGAEYAATKGRCRFYGTPGNGLMIVCFAVYEKDGKNAGAVAMFTRR